MRQSTKFAYRTLHSQIVRTVGPGDEKEVVHLLSDPDPAVRALALEALAAIVRSGLETER